MFRQFGLKLALAVAAATALGCVPAMRAAEGGTLQGVVKSSSGQPLSGAYVKLHNEDKRITFMVISQAQGRYTANGLPAGKYTVQGIGNGYQSDHKPVEVAVGKTVTADVSLTAPQPAALPNSWPGRKSNVGGVEMWVHEPQTPLAEGEGKAIVATKCMQCHETERIVLLRFDPEKWRSTVERMREYSRDLHLKDLTDQEEKVVTEYLAKNYSGEPGSANARPNPNSRLPRTLLTGDAAKYMVVDVELPTPDRDPHDITVDKRGNGWISERNGCCLGKFDPNTFTFTEYNPPAGVAKPRMTSPIAQGAGDTIWVQDASKNRRWLNFDTKTEKFTIYPVPDSFATVNSNTMIVHPNGTVWGAGSTHVMGLDPKTGKFVRYPIPSWEKTKKNANGYGMAVSGDGKIWFAERDVSLIGRLDPATGKIDEFEPPIPNSVPRRMGRDAQGNPWVGLHHAGKMMKIDFETTKMTLYTPPTENSAPYAMVGDQKSGIIWFTEQAADKIVRFDPKTNTFTEYALAMAESDVRRIEIDTLNPNRIWWGGDTSNHLGYIEILK